MVYRNHKIAISLLCISLLFVMIKLFTAVVRLKGDPTTFLVLRTKPSLRTDFNLMTVTPFEDERFRVLLLDENGFIGQGLYYLVTNYFWWGVPVFVFGCFLLALCKKKFFS